MTAIPPPEAAAAAAAAAADPSTALTTLPTAGLTSTLIQGLYTTTSNLLEALENSPSADRLFSLVKSTSQHLSAFMETQKGWSQTVIPIVAELKGIRQASTIPTVIPNEITDSELTTQFEALQRAINDKISTLPAHQQALCVQRVPPDADDHNTIALQVQKTLTNHLIHLGTISIFERYFFKNNPASKNLSPLGVYKQFSSATDPSKAYRDSLHMGRYLLARILMPIIQWFVRLFLRPQGNDQAGIGHFYQIIHDFFKNPDNVKQALLQLLAISGDYFKKLHAIYKEYETKGNGAPLETYIQSRLDAYADYDFNNICQQFNEWLGGLIEVKSGCRLIGNFIDKKLKEIWHTTIKELNILPKLLNSIICGSSLEPNFGYKLLEQMLLQLDKISALLDPQAPLPTSPPPRIFSSTEEEALKEFVSVLMQFFPLENSTISTVHAAIIAADATPKSFSIIEWINSIYSAGIDSLIKWDMHILMVAQRIFIENVARITIDPSLRVQFLQHAVNVLKTPNTSYDLPTYRTKQLDTTIQVNSFLRKTLNDQFADEIVTREVMKIYDHSEKRLLKAAAPLNTFIEMLVADYTELQQLISTTDSAAIANKTSFILIHVHLFCSSLFAEFQELSQFQTVHPIEKNNLKLLMQDTLALLAQIVGELQDPSSPTHLSAQLTELNKRISEFHIQPISIWQPLRGWLKHTEHRHVGERLHTITNSFLRITVDPMHWAELLKRGIIPAISHLRS